MRFHKPSIFCTFLKCQHGIKRRKKTSRLVYIIYVICFQQNFAIAADYYYSIYPTNQPLRACQQKRKTEQKEKKKKEQKQNTTILSIPTINIITVKRHKFRSPIPVYCR